MNKEENEYDKHVDFYWSNLLNSLKLFSYSRIELEQLVAPTFDPIFRNNLIDKSLRKELLDFKVQTDQIPSEIWDWDYIEQESQWIEVRKKANNLLNKLGITDRKYNIST
ncbi:hypothetical protein EMN47_13075 [Prolixibacteraceae bacterium JC049]|nr:hypothetical protein [Prolixibacteraceae bacterium JC049]